MRVSIYQPILLALLILVLPGNVWAGLPESLKVMSFNVRTPVDAAPGKRWEDRRAAMVTMILDVQPAVIGTQELVQEQADYLAAHLPGYRWFGEGRRGGDGDEHMGVFYDSTQMTAEQWGDFWLSDTPDVAGSVSWGNLFPRMVSSNSCRAALALRQPAWFTKKAEPRQARPSREARLVFISTIEIEDETQGKTKARRLRA
ncbi:unnamed protein product [marine sediment metagenome]|uniref:Endonuclease/exonuclease/phosphatase domain-containing protein n=1 Tax=marine sediment metagenome TaxID=412755 RepID=X1MZV7_9ZZZZ